MILMDLNTQQSILRALLDRLDVMHKMDIDYDGCGPYDQAMDELNGIFSQDIDKITGLLDTLDLNDQVDSQILRYLPNLVKNIETGEEKKNFVNYMESLRSRYPNMSFDKILFYANLSVNN